MAHRRADGFLGDPEGDRRWWYTSAYPIRTLLAGSEIFADDRYRIAAQEVLDLFVLEQMPEGGFPQSYQGRGELAKLPAAELDAIRARTWMNLADIGSTVSALAFAIRYVTGERQTRYRAAVRKYLDEWARPFQQPSGGFTNGWLAGHHAKWIYSIATGTTALSFAFYAAATGEHGYIEVAERAVEFLVRDWHDDGRPYIWPFDWYYPRLSLLHASARHRRTVLHPGRHRRGRVDQPQRDGAPACLRGAAPLSAWQPGADRDLGRGSPGGRSRIRGTTPRAQRRPSSWPTSSASHRNSVSRRPSWRRSRKPMRLRGVSSAPRPMPARSASWRAIPTCPGAVTA